MQIKYLFGKTSKKQIFDGCVTKLRKNQLQRLYKNDFIKDFAKTL